MSLGEFALWVVEATIVFVVSTFLFDALHWALHHWERSSIPLLRAFSRWHWVHHKFLSPEMKIDASLVRPNLFAHVLPEYGTATLGTLLFLLVFPWPPVLFVAAIRSLMLLGTLREEGLDFNHMAMERVGGRKSLLWVNQNYHAMHHVYPHSFFSSFVNIFDLIFGTGVQIAGRRFLVTGASGAFGSALVQRLQQAGAIVDTAKSGIEFAAGDYDRLLAKLDTADVLVLAHGARHDDCWNANHRTFVDLIEVFLARGQGRLAPPEVWALGSEVELHGDMGQADLKEYAASKRAFAAAARRYYRSDALVYRHIVPSSFTSAMGKGPMSADTAVRITLLLIRRGLSYVPVTLTSLAVWNYFRFRWGQGATSDSEPNAPLSDRS